MAGLVWCLALYGVQAEHNITNLVDTLGRTSIVQISSIKLDFNRSLA